MLQWNSSTKVGFALLVFSVLVSASLVPVEAFAKSSAEPAADLRLALDDGAVLKMKFPQATSALDVYRALGTACGLNVLFDPKLRDQQLELDLVGFGCQAALDAVSEAAGHFYKVLSPRAAMIIEDTPEQRRNHEKQVMRTFFLENMELKDAMTLLRSLLSVHHAATHNDLRALVLKDTEEVVEQAEGLLAVHDRPRPEVDVVVDVLRVERRLLRALEQGDGLPLRLSAQELRKLKSEGKAALLSRPRLSILDGGSGELRMSDVLRPGGALGAVLASSSEGKPREVGLNLLLRPQVHGSQNEVTLEVEVAVRNLRLAGESLSEGHRELSSQIRLSSGEAFLVTGLTEAGAGGVAGAAASQLARILVSSSEDQGLAEDGYELVLAISPRVIRRSGTRSTGGDAR